MSTSTAIVGGIYVIGGLAAAVFVAWRIAGRVVAESDSLAQRVLVAFVVGLAQLIGVELLAGMLVILYSPVVFVLNLAIAVAVWRLVPAGPGFRFAKVQMGRLEVLLAGVLAFAGAAAVLLTARGAPTDPDDVQYHIPNAASFIRVHDLWHLPIDVPGYFTNAYPSNGELLTSWIIQPFHGAQLAGWPALLFAALILASAGVIAEQLGRTVHSGLLGGAVVVLAPVSWQTQVNSSLTDWAAAAGVMAAIALFLRGRSDPRLRWPILAGVGLGLAVGSKDTALAPAVVVLVFALVALPRGRRWKSVGLALPGIVALAAVWFIRNAVQTGNPVYPEPVKVDGTRLFSGPVSPLTKYSTSLARDVVTGQTSVWHEWSHLVRILVGPPAIVCIAVLLVFFRPRANRLLALVGVMALLFFAIYLVTPYTGPAGSAAELLVSSQLRYSLTALILAAVCACTAYRWVEALAWIGIGADLITIYHGSTFNHDVHLSNTNLLLSLLVGVVVGGVLWRYSGGFRYLSWPDRAPQAAGAVLAVALVVVFAAVAVHRAPRPTALDRALAAEPGASARTVMVVGDTNVVAALGPHLDRRVVTAGTGSGRDMPPTTTAELDEVLAAARPGAVLVGVPGQTGVIANWAPPGYRLLGVADGNREYLLGPRPISTG